MRIALWLLSLLTLSSVVSAQDAFCVKYSKALFGVSNKTTNYALLNAVVARVTVGCNNDLAQAFGVPVPATSPYAAYAPQACGNNGITVVRGLVQDPLNAPFFAGTAPFFQSFTNAAKLNAFPTPKVLTTPGLSIPFVAVNTTTRAVTPFPATLGGNIAANVISEGLITHLITFFGAALGCDSIDNAKDTVIQPPANTFIGRYNGVVNMTQVHQGMAINAAVWNEFANTFVQALKSFGVTQADIEGTITPYLKTFLRGPAGSDNVICNQPDCDCAPKFTLAANGQCVVPATTFCQKYAKALFGAATLNTQYALLNAVVARVTIGCNNTVAQAFGVANVTNTPYAAYAAQACGNAGITSVPGLVQDALNAPFFAGSAPFFQSFTNAEKLNVFSGTAPLVGQTGITSIPFVGVKGKIVTPFASTLGGNIAQGNFQEGLITHLISFFGRDLGCDTVIAQNTMIAPTNKAFIGKYNGNQNMTQVHQGMKITFAVWNEFVNTFVQALKSFGVTQADIDGTITPYLKQFLRGPVGSSNVICNQADCPCALIDAKATDTFNLDANGQCVAPKPLTFCQTYAKKLFGNSNAAFQYQLLNAVVARVTVGCNNNLAQAFGVPGVANTPFAAYSPQVCGNAGVTMVPGLVQDTLNAPFFAGTAPMYKSVTGLGALNTLSPPPAVAGVTFPSIRFVGVNATSRTVAPYAATVGVTANEGLIQHLIAFFGRDLGCDIDPAQNTLQTGANPFIGKYNGVVNMTAVHQGMAINQFVWDEFVNTFVKALQSFGVSQADIDGTVKPYLAQFLRGPAGTDNVICNQPNCMCAPQFIKDTATGNCVAQITTPTVAPTPAPPKVTFCTKYATALFPTATLAVAEYKLLQAVIARVILGCDNNLATAFGVPGVAGIPELAAFQASACGNVAGFAQVNGLVADPLNGPFFNGVAPNYNSVTQAFALNVNNNVSQLLFPSIRFVEVNGFAVKPEPAALGGQVPFDAALGLPAGTTMFVEGLITHLIAFFGRDLGCQSIDFNHDTITSPITKANIGKYNGATSMFQVHQNMKITQAVWNEFANTFIGALKSFGVTQADIDGTIVPYVSQFLRGPTNMADMMICNQPDCACAPQFKLVNGQCVDPANPNPGVGANGQGGARIGTATSTWASPLIVVVVSIMTYLLA